MWAVLDALGAIARVGAMSFDGKRVGKFTVSVREPSPPWIELAMEGAYGGGSWLIHPNDLEDLVYALGAAKAELARMHADAERRGSTL